jgi:hypothetical protein
MARHTTYPESVLPPGPWHVVGNKILAGKLTVGVIMSANAHAVAEQIAVIVNESASVMGVIDSLQAQVNALNEENERLRDSLAYGDD